MERPTTKATVLTLAGAGVVFIIMAFWGINAATAPMAGNQTDSTSTSQCSDAEKTIQTHVNRKDVTVSVYNASKRTGLASEVLNRLERNGFRPGAVGNAPEGLSADIAVVYAKDTTSTSAKLVALAFGPDTQILTQEVDLGPGINIVVGDQFQRLDQSAPHKLELPEPIITCVKVD